MVNICAMKPELAEIVINICNHAIRFVRRLRSHESAPTLVDFCLLCRDKVTEQEAAHEVKAKLKEKFPDGLWQVRQCCE